MAKIKYTECTIRNLDRVHEINEIIDEFMDEGYKLTLRQLYYQLVSKAIIPNQVSEYAKLSKLLTKGRMCGMVDWDAIEDRIRTPILPYYVFGVEDAINDTIKDYRLDRQYGQKYYINVLVEKDALSGVLKPITGKYHINLIVCRGYLSCTAMHDMFLRFRNQEFKGKQGIILYLGDHDPSGLDMIRDIKERLAEFGTHPTIVPVGITMKQIKRYKPPTNPAKITDPRADWYIEKYGKYSWEVDALNPKVLNKLLTTHIEHFIDMNLFKRKLLQEKKDKNKIYTIYKENLA